MRRRDLIKAAAALSALPAAADVPTHLWSGYDFGPAPQSANRLNQGPFGIEQDDGWYTLAGTTAAEGPVPNFGLGLVGYTWEESGPSLAARAGHETLEQHVERMASLPFVDVLYIRCDWRDVQKQAGRLDLHPVWRLTLDAARRHNKRVAFRVMVSNTVGQPKYLALPDFVQAKVPVVEIGSIKGYGDFKFREPRYDHPEFLKAFRGLVELLAAEFDGNPLVEWMDLMQYGLWGEGHTGGMPNPFPDYATAERTMVELTRLQIDAFRRAQLAVNSQPDISNTGNREVVDMCVRSGAWLRSDSIMVEEPEQIEALANRPPWLASILEDGYFRQYDIAKPGYLPRDPAGVNMLEHYMLHTLDLGSNYWSLWTESANLAAYERRFPRGFAKLRQRLGYRVRPSWIWQRKRYGAHELVVAFANDGVAGVPGVLVVTLKDASGRVIAAGSLDAGHPHGGRIRQAAFPVPSEFEGKTVFLSADLEGKAGMRRPVRWACEQPLAADGSLEITIRRASDPNWRKGI
ncbi:hypothetical protein [uncultured Paludibaculum sp.]|uniref:hypothetical protein n=1 Tax=uncultured Paludibaculum sp. TaxID=1765020 RepID=UPI002AABE4AC|nr:hypothetical protein [uncultured Paludibaculum sp.]